MLCNLIGRVASQGNTCGPRAVLFLLSLPLLLLSGCASVVIDYDKQARFTGYTSYAFMTPSEGRDYLSLDAARIERSLNRELAARGLQPVLEEEADILVRYDIETEIRNESTGFSYGLGYGRGAFGLGVMTPPDSNEVREGKLVVEFVTPKDKRAIWRGAARRNLTESMRPDARQALIDQLITEMLEKYPPKA